MWIDRHLVADREITVGAQFGMRALSSSGTGWSKRQFDAHVPLPEGQVEPTVVEELRTNSLNRVRVSSLMTMRSRP